MDTNIQPRAIISAIIEKEENHQKYIFLQTRWKPTISPTYSGLLEIPAGAIESYENVIDALKREVEEETGFKIVQIYENFEEITENIVENKAKVFKPFLCQQMLSSVGGLPWVGYVFRCQVIGEAILDEKEAKDPQWISIEKLGELLSTSPEKFFPLQFPVLKYYVENFDKI